MKSLKKYIIIFEMLWSMRIEEVFTRKDLLDFEDFDNDLLVYISEETKTIL